MYKYIQINYKLLHQNNIAFTKVCWYHYLNAQRHETGLCLQQSSNYTSLRCRNDAGSQALYISGSHLKTEGDLCWSAGGLEAPTYFTCLSNQPWLCQYVYCNLSYFLWNSDPDSWIWRFAGLSPAGPRFKSKDNQLTLSLLNTHKWSDRSWNRPLWGVISQKQNLLVLGLNFISSPSTQNKLHKFKSVCIF